MNVIMPLVRDRFWLDRPALLARFEDQLRIGAQVLLLDTVATYGSGKTTLLSQLYEKLSLDGEVQPIWVSLDRVRLWQPGGEARDEPGLSDDYKVFRNVLRAVLERLEKLVKLSPQVTRNFVHRMGELESEILLAALRQAPSLRFEKASTGNLSVGAGAKIYNSTVTTGDIIIDTEGVYDTILEEATENLRRRVTDEFLDIVQPSTAGKRYVLLADGFCSVIGRHVGSWILDLLQQLDNVAVVVARTVTPGDLPVSRAVKLPLPPFTIDEVERYLRNRFGAIAGLEGLAGTICSFSRGHVGTVALAADSIRRDELANMEGVCDFFRWLNQEQPAKSSGKPDLQERYRVLLEEILCDIQEKDPELIDAVQAGTVLRCYSRDAIESVLSRLAEKDAVDEHAPRHSANHYSSLVKRMSNYSFVEERAPETKLPTYAFHNFVRSQLESRLQTENPQRYEQLHRSACEYYQDRMNAVTENQNKKVYLRNFRLEEKNWQYYATEWLYHLGAWPDRAAARLHFARVYFEAFNWWEWLLPFEYCARLLLLWQDVLALWPAEGQASDDQELLDLLHQLNRCYPKGYDKHNLGDWKGARAALRNLKMLLKLRDKPEDLDPDRQTILGFIEWFIAQSYRFSVPQDFTNSEKHFLASRSVFEAADDTWNLLWTDSYMADLYMEMGQRYKATDLAESSLEAATSDDMDCIDEQDHEVISQNYRILGDVYWSAGELGPAFRDYARAVFHAWVFNVIPVPPDDYTRALYASVCSHVARRILGLQEDGRQTAAQSAAEYEAGCWQVYWEACDTVREAEALQSLLEMKDPEALASCIFPPAPATRDDIRRVKGVSEEMCGAMADLEPAPMD